MESNINYNKVFIIESLPNSHIGVAKMIQSDVANKIDCDILNVHSQSDWLQCWNTISEECNNGRIPIIHIMAHGHKEGINIMGYKTLAWRELLQQLHDVNVVCNNKLFVIMQVCYGAYCLSDLLDMESIPFYGLLASPDEIDFMSSTCALIKCYLQDIINLDEFVITFQTQFNSILKSKGNSYIGINSRWIFYNHINYNLSCLRE